MNVYPKVIFKKNTPNDFSFFFVCSTKCYYKFRYIEVDTISIYFAINIICIILYFSIFCLCTMLKCRLLFCYIACWDLYSIALKKIKKKKKNIL